MAPSLAFHHPPGSGWWASPSQKLCTECWGPLGLCSHCVFQAGCCSRPLGGWSRRGSPLSWSVTVGRILLYERFNFSRMAKASSFLIRILTSAFQKQNLNTVAPTSAGGLSGVKTSLQRLWTSLFKVRDVQSASKGPRAPCVGTLPSHWEDELGGDCWPFHRRLYKGHSHAISFLIIQDNFLTTISSSLCGCGAWLLGKAVVKTSILVRKSHFLPHKYACPYLILTISIMLSVSIMLAHHDLFSFPLQASSHSQKRSWQ